MDISISWYIQQLMCINPIIHQILHQSLPKFATSTNHFQRPFHRVRGVRGHSRAVMVAVATVAAGEPMKLCSLGGVDGWESLEVQLWMMGICTWYEYEMNIIRIHIYIYMNMIWIEDMMFRVYRQSHDLANNKNGCLNRTWYGWEAHHKNLK